MLLLVAGHTSNKKNKNRYSGVQGLAWTTGKEDGSNVFVCKPRVRGNVFGNLGLAGPIHHTN
jgi:hypothetical protein